VKIILCFLLFLFFFVSIPVNSALAELPSSEKELLDEIIKLESEEKYHTALRLVDDFILEYPDSFEAKTYRCGLLNNAEYPIEDIEQCLDAVSLSNPTKLNTMMNYGVLYYKMSEYEKSRDIFNEILMIYPDNPRAKSLFYTISLITEPDNVEYVNELLELSTKTHDIQALNNVIKFLNDKDEFDEADKLLIIAEEIEPDNSDILTHRGVWYAKQGDLEIAKRYFGDALENDRNDITTLNNLGLLYRELGDEFNDVQYYQDCILYYKSVLTLDKQNTFAQIGENHCTEKRLEIDTNNLYFQLSLVVLSVSASSIAAILIMHHQNRQDKIKHQKEQDVKQKEKLRKRLISSRIFTIIFTGALAIPVVLAAIIVIFRISPIEGMDVSNWATMIVEIGIGAIIAAVILSYELSKQEDYKRQQSEFDKQQKKMSRLVKDAKQIQEEQLKFVKDERERINNWKTRWGSVIREDLQFINQLYDALEQWIIDYKKNPSAQLKSNIIDTSQRNGELVKMTTDNIVSRDLPSIEIYF